MRKMNQIQIIVNNGAGTGKAFQVWNETQKLLRRYKVNYTAYATRYRGHATRLAEKISTMGGKAQVYLIVVGGDGTINEVLNGIRDFDRVRLGGESATDPGVHPQGPPGQRTSADRSGTGFLGRLQKAQDLRNQCRGGTGCSCV